MGRTYKGLSKKDREALRRERDARRYKHWSKEEEEDDDTDNGKSRRNGKGNVRRNDDYDGDYSQFQVR